MMATRRPGRKAAPPDRGSPVKVGPPTQVEERLLVAAAQSDPAKFDALYELHFERVYGFVASRTHDRGTAEDVTSEVFHKALANLPRYEWRGISFAAWLLRIAANAIVDQAKRATREFISTNDPAEIRGDPVLQASELRAIEYRAKLLRSVGQLPEVQRRVIHERFVEQRSIREIAQKLGKSEGAVKQLQLRALQRLRVQIGGGHA